MYMARFYKNQIPQIFEHWTFERETQERRQPSNAAGTETALFPVQAQFIAFQKRRQPLKREKTLNLEQETLNNLPNIR